LIKRRVAIRAVAAAGVAALALSVGAPVASAKPKPPAQSTPQVVATGLDSPRHLRFSADGSLYVVEAGRGGDLGCVDNPELGPLCLGMTGAVTRVGDNGSTERVLTGLPSITGSDTLGPSDIAFTGNQKFVLSIGLGGDVAFRDAYGADGALLGTLVSGKLKEGGVSLFADVLANEAANNPDGTDINSDPTGFVRDGNSYILADSGGNDVVQANHKGTFNTVAVLPPVDMVAPPFLGLPPGTIIPADSVPTAVTRGPDGALYISELTGFPFQEGAASIFRIVPGQAPTVFATGLTNVTDLEFDASGTLYAVEIASTGLLNPPVGSLVKVNPGSSTHDTVIGDLASPYGVAIRNGAAYVSTCSVCICGGEVLLVPLS
jgi:hypothetical protein